MSEPDADHEETPFAFFRNEGKSTDEGREAWREAWATVRDEAFPIPIMCGSELPNFSIGVSTCDSGCHVRIYLVDEANDEAYLVHDVPVEVAQMSNMIDSAGNLNPVMQRAAMARWLSSLN